MCATSKQQVLVAFSKSSSSTFLATAVTGDTQYKRKSSQNSQANSAEVLAGITTLKI